MKNLKISININASKQKIWKTIVDPHLYKLWTHVFSSTSYFEGGWNKGDSIRFLAFNKKGNVQGMISEIAESDFPNHISIRHLGYIENGIEDTSSDAILTWAPAYENYTLVDEGSNLTRFELDTDVDETYYEMMLEKWPKAMQELKIIAESLGDQKIYPCLWFNNEAKEAVNHYATIFQNFLTLDQNDFATSFEINGCKFMAMNGGLHYKVNSAVSYFIYCESEKEILRIYDALKEEGTLLMPLGKYEWSPQYAWVIDKYGVNWQLDVEAINNSQKVVPNLLFVNNKNHLVGSAVDFYTEVFKKSSTLMKAPYPPDAGMPQGALLFAQYKLYDVIFNAMSSTMQHDYDFTPGNSFVIECSSQDEIDYYWQKLGEEGQYSRCGWLTDRYGLSWQVIPNFLPKLTADPIKGPKVIQAFMSMTKYEIEPLLEAAEF